MDSIKKQYLNLFDSDKIIQVEKMIIDSKDITISEGVDEVISELEILGYRDRTLNDYRYHCSRFSKITGIELIKDITRDSLIQYISQGNIKNSTRRVRLKTIRSVFNKFYKKNWITTKFWDDIQIKVDETVKVGTVEEDIIILISQLDFNDYIEFRDSCIFLLMWENGVRITTIGKLETNMIDFDNNLITYEGRIMKNHKKITLPISNELSSMLHRLSNWNREKGLSSNRIFLSTRNTGIEISNSFSKRVETYREKFNVYNINPHAIRRGFAKRLLDKGVSLPVISKALGHQTLDTTTKYLHISQDELIKDLRKV